MRRLETEAKLPVSELNAAEDTPPASLLSNAVLKDMHWPVLKAFLALHSQAMDQQEEDSDDSMEGDSDENENEEFFSHSKLRTPSSEASGGKPKSMKSPQLRHLIRNTRNRLRR